MRKESKLVQKWVDTYGIHAVLDAEESRTSNPVSSGWDLKKVWTCWDSYDQMGSFVSPGYIEKLEIEGDLFVSAWYIGSKDFKESSQDVTIMDRDVCEECETEGCESCEGLGWIETYYLPETTFQFNKCSNCATALVGKFCSNCGQAASQ